MLPEKVHMPTRFACLPLEAADLSDKFYTIKLNWYCVMKMKNANISSFQTVRNLADLWCMVVLAVIRKITNFNKLTIFEQSIDHFLDINATYPPGNDNNDDCIMYKAENITFRYSSSPSKLNSC